jgi:hypothetical protein
MDCAVLIAAPRPTRALLDLVRNLARHPLAAILIVDDGTGDGLFDELAAMPQVSVLRHAVPLGKRDAIKTGANYALLHTRGGLVIADHAEAAEIINAAANLQESPDALIVAHGVHGIPRVLMPDALAHAKRAWRPRAAARRLGLRIIDPARDRLLGRLILAALAVLIVIACLGLRAPNLFRASNWFPSGPWPLLQFIGIYASCACALLILLPWAFAGAWASAILIVSATTLGPMPVLAAVFFLLSCWCLGRLLLPASEGVLPLLLGIAVYIFAMQFAARLPVNYPAVYLTALAIPIALVRRLPRFAIPLGAWGERIAFAALALLLTLHWLAALKPESSADALSMHLAIPLNIADHHVLTYQPSRFVWSVMPMGVDFAYSIAVVPGGEYAAHLVNFAALAVILGLIYSAGRRWVSPAVAYLLAALFASAPMVQTLTGSLFIENLLAALIFGCLAAIWKFGDTGDRRFLYAAAILGGAAISSKFGAMAAVLMEIPLAAIEIRRRRRGWMPAAALLLITAAPPYAIAMIKTRNPIFPFVNTRFRSPLYPIEDVQNRIFREPLSWRAPFDLVFHTHRFWEFREGSFGVQYLLLAPLALFAFVPRRRQAIGAAAVALLSSVAVLRSEPNARYLYSALPLLYVPCAALVGWAAEHHRPLWRALLAACAACLAINVCLLPMAGYYYRLYPPWTEPAREKWLALAAPGRLLAERLNRNHPRAAVLLTKDSFAAGFQGDVYENQWHQKSTQLAIESALDAAALHRLLESWNVHFVIGHLPLAEAALSPALSTLLSNCAVPESTADVLYLARLEDDCSGPSIPKSPPHPTIIAGKGVYDDSSHFILFRGGWLHDDQFAEAKFRTVTYTDAAGAAAAFAFRGSGLIWTFTRAPNRGIAHVTIDSTAQGEFDLYSDRTEWQRSMRFEHLDAGPHLLVIRATGKRGAGAQGSFIDIDSLEVKP